MRLAWIKIALFVLVLLAPVVSLACLGTVGNYGQQTHPDYPRADQLLRGKKGRWDQLGEAILHRSPAEKLAIRVRSWMSYRVVGFVDTEKVVSGEGDWLFFRLEFGGGRCLDEAEVAASLRRLAVLSDIGRAAGIDMFIAMSPDKSTIYPEKLNRSVRGYWRCRTESVAAVRRLMKLWAPMLIDHAEALLAEKARHPDVALYFTTDTHWSPYGAAVGLRHLLTQVFPGEAIPSPRLSGETVARPTDLGLMLLSSSQEEFAILDPARETALKVLNRDPAGYRTIVIGDSFYAAMKPAFKEIFPNGNMIEVRSDDTGVGPEVATADRLILSRVERSLVRSDVFGLLKWDQEIPLAVLARNAARAKDCAGFAGPARSTSDGSSIIDVPAGSAGRMPCLRLTLAARKPGILVIALPNPASGAFEPGREFRYRITPDHPVINLVLPDYVAGAHIRLQVEGGNPIEMRTIEMVEIDRPAGLRTAQTRPQP